MNRVQSAIGRDNTWSHPEQRVEEFVDGDIIELALFRSTHSGPLGEGYDNIFWSLLENLL